MSAQQAGGSRPRLTDVAAAAGVSTASASLVLRSAPGPSAETRRRVSAAAQRLGYRADRNASLLARRRRHLLGVLLDVRNPFHAELAEEIHVAAEGRGYDVVLSTLTRTRGEMRGIETLLDFRSEALLLLGPDGPVSTLDELATRSPVVVVGRRMPRTAVDVVRAADDSGVAAAVDHLADLGHCSIAFIDGGRGTIASDRRRGYRTAMRRRALETRIRILAGGHKQEAGAEAARRLLSSSELPTAVACSNDSAALGVLDVLMRAGVGVPTDVSVLGYDDSPTAQLAQVSLTTVNQQLSRMAEEAVSLAIERLDEGRSEPREVVLTPFLVVRGTTGPPRSIRRPQPPLG